MSTSGRFPQALSFFFLVINALLGTPDVFVLFNSNFFLFSAIFLLISCHLSLSLTSSSLVDSSLVASSEDFHSLPGASSAPGQKNNLPVEAFLYRDLHHCHAMGLMRQLAHSVVHLFLQARNANPVFPLLMNCSARIASP